MTSIDPQAVRALTDELHGAANLLTTPSAVAHLMVSAATALEWYAVCLENYDLWRATVDYVRVCEGEESGLIAT